MNAPVWSPVGCRRSACGGGGWAPIRLLKKPPAVSLEYVFVAVMEPDLNVQVLLSSTNSALPAPRMESISSWPSRVRKITLRPVS